eukprot:10792061-Prorocentrum_lima.AAC.1
MPYAPPPLPGLHLPPLLPPSSHSVLDKSRAYPVRAESQRLGEVRSIPCTRQNPSGGEGRNHIKSTTY